jgi:hypothetical protein
MNDRRYMRENHGYGAKKKGLRMNRNPFSYLVEPIGIEPTTS